jgi:hypothetical protein
MIVSSALNPGAGGNRRLGLDAFRTSHRSDHEVIPAKAEFPF